MKKKCFKLFTGLVFFILLFSACIDNETDLVGYGDAYILVENTAQDTLKGLGLHAFSYSSFSSVVVNLSGNSTLTWTLEPYLDYEQDYIWFTPHDQYTKTLPAAGDYVFNASFTDGQSLTFYDKLTSEYILPPKIKSCQFIKQTERISVEWESVKDADAYNVKLLDSDGNFLFVSPAYNSTLTNFSFGKDSQGWQSTNSFPDEGQIVVVELAAYLMEVPMEGGDLQCISKSRTQITWGNL